MSENQRPLTDDLASLRAAYNDLAAKADGYRQQLRMRPRFRPRGPLPLSSYIMGTLAVAVAACYVALTAAGCQQYGATVMAAAGMGGIGGLAIGMMCYGSEEAKDPEDTKGAST